MAQSIERIQDIQVMSSRISEMRESLKANILKAGSQKNWEHITTQVGMFAYTGLTKEQVIRIRDEFSVYMTMDGRISIAGLNQANVEYVAKCFHEVTK